jgi:hypothetical protein
MLHSSNIRPARLLSLSLSLFAGIALIGCNGDGADAVSMSPSDRSQSSEDWVELFNGKDLTGWEPMGEAVWTVEDGVLTGTQGAGGKAGDLFFGMPVSDFELKVVYKVDWPANSGIWFRYQAPGVAYQADILRMPDAKAYSGSVYCPGVPFIATNEDPELANADGWNTMRIRAVEDHIQVWLNGTQVADTHDERSARGRIGLQVHEGEVFNDMALYVKEARLRVID